MLDLNSTLFFKGKVEIASNEECDLLWDMIIKIRSWMTKKWEKNGETIPSGNRVWTGWKFGSNFSSENNIIHFKSTHHCSKEEMHSWACKIIESWPSKDGCAPREWVTEIGFQQKATKRAAVSIVIYYSDRPGFIGPCEPAPQASIPRLIRMFCKDPKIECTAGGHLDFLRAVHLVPGDFPTFWKMVCDESRELPLVYISPRKDAERKDSVKDSVKNLLDPRRLAGILGPNALIYYADDLDFSREMTQLCLQDGMGCYAGSVRVYAPHPHVKDPDDVYRHRLITAKNILGAEDAVYDILRRALAQDVHFYERMFRMEDCQKLIEKDRTAQKLAEYQASLEEDLAAVTLEKEQDLQKKLQQIDLQQLEWEMQKDELEGQISALKEELYNAKACADIFREEASLSLQRKNALDAVRTIRSYPGSPTEIAEYFQLHFGDRIVFTNRGMASLRDCHTDLKILWDALFQMATLLYDLYDSDDTVAIDREFNRSSSFQMARGAGSMTRKDANLMRQYKDSYDGREIDIETHIKSSQTKESSPQFLRIYYCYDLPTRKLVIGSCGKHLDNYSTKKMH